MLNEWCPCYQGIKDNEPADCLARKGLDQNLLPSDRFLSYSYLVEGIRKSILFVWRSDWTKQVLREEEGRKAIGLGHFNGISARNSVPNFKTKAPNLSTFSRGAQSSYVQVRTGIGKTLAYLCKIVKLNSDLHCSFFTKREKDFKALVPLNLQILFYIDNGKTRHLQFVESSRYLLPIKSPGEERLIF